MEKICIIIPAYNEEKRIERTLEGYSKYFSELNNHGILDLKILVVINGSIDGTENVVQGFVESNKNISYIKLVEAGKGNAVIQGFKKALKEDYGLIGFSDADMATPPEEFFKLIKACEGFDGAIADRYQKKSKITPRPSFQRLIAKRMFNFVSRALLILPYGDTQCGAKIFRRESLERIMPKITMSKWAFDVDLLYNLHKKNFKIKSVPISWHDEAYSTLNFWKSGPGMVLGIVRLRLINSPLKSFVKFYDKFLSKS